MCFIAGTYTAASCTECRKLFINWFLYLDEYVEMQWGVIVPSAISTETRAVAVAAPQHTYFKLAANIESTFIYILVYNLQISPQVICCKNPIISFLNDSNIFHKRTFSILTVVNISLTNRYE